MSINSYIKSHIVQIKHSRRWFLFYGLLMFCVGGGLNMLLERGPQAKSDVEVVTQKESDGKPIPEVSRFYSGAQQVFVQEPAKVASLVEEKNIELESDNEKILLNSSVDLKTSQEVPSMSLFSLAKAESVKANNMNAIMPSAGEKKLEQIPADVSPVKSVSTGVEIKTIEVKKGDTFSSLLYRQGVGVKETFLVGKSLGNVYPVSRLKVGTQLQLSLVRKKTKGYRVKKLRIDESAFYVESVVGEKGRFKAYKKDKPLVLKVAYKEGVISKSLYGMAKREQIPTGIIEQFVSILSFDVDFQRDIKKGTKASILYEQWYDEGGELVTLGDILYLSVTLEDTTIAIYHFNDSSMLRLKGYYKADGRSTQRSLMKTPINGAIISSHYGMRKHPILGYDRMHTGVDFAAPRGTPIYAAGDGRVTYVGRKGGYGKYIKINHGGGFETAYAHLKGYAKGMKKSKRVNQGQVIGFVGTTGASTGPHLHYEIIKNGKHINPLRVSIPPGRQLKGDSMKKFERIKQSVLQKIKNHVVE